MTRKYKQVV